MSNVLTCSVLCVVWVSGKWLVTTSFTTQSPDVASRMQLYMQPAGPVLQGDTVNVICRVTDKHLLDIVRLVRYPLNNDTRHSDVITTNGVIEGLFKVMSRYKVVEWNESRGLIELQIASETPCTLNTL